MTFANPGTCRKEIPCERRNALGATAIRIQEIISQGNCPKQSMLWDMKRFNESAIKQNNVWTYLAPLHQQPLPSYMQGARNPPNPNRPRWFPGRALVPLLPVVVSPHRPWGPQSPHSDCGSPPPWWRRAITIVSSQVSLTWVADWFEMMRKNWMIVC